MKRFVRRIRIKLRFERCQKFAGRRIRNRLLPNYLRSNNNSHNQTMINKYVIKRCHLYLSPSGINFS